MMVDMVMPFLSETMQEGTVLRWLKQVGDHVAAGEEFVEIETDKLTISYEADTSGVLVEIVVEAGLTVLCGAVIARIRTGDPESAIEVADD